MYICTFGREATVVLWDKGGCVVLIEEEGKGEARSEGGVGGGGQ